jgi:hypothetical protein
MSLLMTIPTNFFKHLLPVNFLTLKIAGVQFINAGLKEYLPAQKLPGTMSIPYPGYLKHVRINVLAAIWIYLHGII